MAQCIFCQHELDAASPLCPHCGRVQPPGTDDTRLAPPGVKAATRRCPACNEVLPAAARFCGHCGQVLGPLEEAAEPAESPSDADSTLVLNKPLKLAALEQDDSAAPPADTRAESPNVSFAVESVRNQRRNITGELARSGGEGRPGVAHGIRYRLFSRLQARVVTRVAVAALVMLVVGAGTLSLYGTRGAFTSGSATPTTLVVLATDTPVLQPTATATATATPQLVTPTPSPQQPTATPTSKPPTPTPLPRLVISPQAFTQTCNGTQPLPALMITLDNSRNAVSASWQANITQKDSQGHIWAAANPTSGTIPAGQTALLKVTPLATLCQELQQGGPPVSFLLMVVFTLQGSVAQTATVIDTVTPPA